MSLADSGTITQVCSGAAAIAAAYGAYRVNRRDADAEDLRTAKRQVRDLKKDLLTLRGYIFSVQTTYAEHGVAIPDPPRLLSEDWD